MSDKYETTDDIIREMRDLGALDEKSVDMIPRSLQALGLRTYAARLEAAAERERVRAEAMRHALERILDIEGYGAPMIEVKCIAQKALEGQQCTPPLAQAEPKIEQPGNAAVMREALEFAEEELWAHGVFDSSKRVAAALAAPARNCDRYTTWKDAWDAFTAAYFGPTDPGEMEYSFGVWLFAPPKEARE